jgi:uncharacterized protein YkwD
MKIRTLLTAAVITLAAPAAASACAGADLDPSAATGKQTRAAVVCLVNAERAAHGLGALRRARPLATAARTHAADMVSRGYFAHETPEGSTPAERIARTGWTPETGRWYVGENLAWGAPGNATPRDTVRNWMNSPSHRENVLRPMFREIGIGVVAGSPEGSGAGAFTYAASFGRR